MSSIFTKIINREFSAFIIKEDDEFIAFLDIMPLQEGHVLVVPKIEVDKIYDLPLSYQTNLLVFASTISKAIEKSFNKRVGFAVIGIEVPHAHLHLVPIANANDINFTNPKLTISKERLKEIQDLIISNLS